MGKLSPRKKIAKRLLEYRYGKGYKGNQDEQMVAEAVAENIINDLI